MERPDSALAVLDSIDRTLLSSDRNRAHHALLHAMALDKNFIDVSNDSIAQIAVGYYSRRGSDRHYARSLYYLGVAYYYQGAYDKAILELTKAERVAMQCDSLYWGMTKSFQARSYDRTYNNKEELNCLRDAYRIYDEIGDVYKKQAVNLRMANLYSAIFNYDKSEIMFKDLIESPMTDSLIKSYALCGYAFMNVVRSELDLALGVYETILNEAPDIMTQQDYWAYAYALSVSGRKEESKVVIAGLDDNNSVAKYWLYRIYDEDKQYYDALKCLEESNLLDDEEIENTLSQSLSLTQRNYYKSQLQLAEYKAKNRIKTVIVILAVSALFIILIVFLALRRISLQNEEKERYIQYAAEIRLQLQKAKSEDYPALKKKYLDLYKTRFETIGAIYEQCSLTSGIENAEHLIYEKVQSMVSDFRNEISDTAEFEAMLNADLDDVVSRLRNEVSRIKQVDVSMFCFMAIGFDVTTISHLMNVSMNTIYIRKSRLRQKIEELSPMHKEQFLQILGENSLSRS
jgi:tetratricopeptide (TPR) repeat protein